MRRFVITYLVLNLLPYATCLAQKKFEAQAVSRSIKLIAARIAADSTVDSKLVGFAPITTEQYNRFQKMAALARESELVVLTDHPSPAVRCYAYQELYNRASLTLLPILHKNELDTATVAFRNGCLINNLAVVDYMCFLFYKQQKQQPLKLSAPDTLLLDRITDARWKRRAQ